ncbi:MAG: FadR/GntR family transcriptional regulator [Eubacteriales bacterium]|jgi:GntR family transcriptional repressor for pyruvate dehydrogenase complex
MPIKSIKKASVSDQIFDQMLSMISAGEWKCGEKILSENELAAMFQVSRNSVRAALQKLSALGLLESRQGEGTFVSNESASNIYFNSLLPSLMWGNFELQEILEFRKIIEIETVKLAAQRATPEEIQELQELEDRMRREVQENQPYDKKKFARDDMYFHETIARCARNSVLNRVYSIVKDALVVNQVLIQDIVGPKYTFVYHPQIIEAIRNRDPERAGKLMEEHLDVTISQAHRLNGEKRK